ncbi:MAG TPA: LysR family transcriptional regulator [Verrucomicrobiales bacterium]|nr:LysR family transcriptional regulator [Verrucomicrobiales bacterium]HRJ08899.1 LysR family transcriptional regulator [Prosthecobacter sp.]HRK15218.1 LysR family transcriptional regulator [Prosthecobacter sp.]
MQSAELNYHHLRLFWEAARSGGLREAAERLDLSQPTLSAQIKTLEESLGEKLFERSGRGLKLTAKGRQVMDHAGRIFALGGEMIRSLSEGGSAMSPCLNLGVTQSLPKLVSWRLISKAVHEMPGLHFTCHEGQAADLVGQLVSGRLDVVLADESAPASLRVRAFDRVVDRSRVVFCAAKPLARRWKADFPKSLNQAPVVLPSMHSAWRRELDRWFESKKITPRIAAEFDDSALMKTAAADGLGIVPIASSVLEEAVDRYDLTPFGPPVQCCFESHLITLEKTLRHPALAALTAAVASGGKVMPV